MKSIYSHCCRHTTGPEAIPEGVAIPGPGPVTVASVLRFRSTFHRVCIRNSCRLTAQSCETTTMQTLFVFDGLLQLGISITSMDRTIIMEYFSGGSKFLFEVIIDIWGGKHFDGHVTDY